MALQVEVDGEALVHQPPVPFFSAKGFYSGPTGPFNPSADPSWTVGESASFSFASTNHPALTPGAELSVTVPRDGRVVARVTTTIG